MSVSQYTLNNQESAYLAAPVQQDRVYATDNASANAPFGTNTREQILFDSAGYQFFNSTLFTGVDCAKINSGAGRPSALMGQACYSPNAPSQQAAKQMNTSYNATDVSAKQMILAQGELLYAPARFSDQNNYAGPSMNDGSYKPQLLGTVDVTPSECHTVNVNQTYGATNVCPAALGYGSSVPSGQFWSGLSGMGAQDMSGCAYADGTTMCGLSTVGGQSVNAPPAQYSGPQAVPVGQPRHVRMLRK